VRQRSTPDGGRRALLQVSALTALLPSFPVAAGLSDGVRVILGPEAPAQRDLVAAIRARYPAADVDTNVGRLLRRGGAIAYVAMGPAALQAAQAQRLDAPVICLLTSRQAYARIAAERPQDRSVTAIFAEPSPSQQMRLIAAIHRRRVVVGAFISPQSTYLAPLLRQAAVSNQLDLELAPIEPDASLSRNLVRLANAAVVLVFPDSAIYTQQSLRELLESSYRRRQPVIGFSQALVTAGTLASAYADASDTAAHLHTILEGIAAGRLPEPEYPRYWRVAINDSVARSLDVVVDDAVRSMGDRP
jgi:putative tryptophan/tyrosine transport system substrate-binding protein